MPCRKCVGEPNKLATSRTSRDKLLRRNIRTSSSSLLFRRSSTFLRTIRGWFTEIPSWRGRVGTRIPASGMTVLSFRGESALRSAGSAVGNGAGVIGDLIGAITTSLTTMAATTPAAPPSTTGTISTGAESRVAKLSTGVMPGGVRVPTVLASRSGPSMETAGVLEDMPNPEAKAASAREPSMATNVAESRGAFRHVEAPALAEEASVAEVMVVAALAAEAMLAVAGTGRTQLYAN